MHLSAPFPRPSHPMARARRPDTSTTTPPCPTFWSSPALAAASVCTALCRPHDRWPFICVFNLHNYFLVFARL